MREREIVEKQVACFGMTKQEVLDGFRKVMETSPPHMILTSILSDVQEELERGDKERARQNINVVKLLLIEAFNPLTN